MWLSLVERCVRDAKAAGSNPVIPTTYPGAELRGFLFTSHKEIKMEPNNNYNLEGKTENLEGKAESFEGKVETEAAAEAKTMAKDPANFVRTEQGGYQQTQQAASGQQGQQAAFAQQPQGGYAQNYPPQGAYAYNPYGYGNPAFAGANKSSGGGWKKGIIIFLIVVLVVGIAGWGCSRAIRNTFSSLDVYGGNAGSGSSVIDFGYDYVGVMYLEGTITDGDSGDGYSQDWMLTTIEDMTYDDNNKGILLHVNTPGGSSYATVEVYEKLLDYKEITGRPIYVYMGSQATSGGYYVSMAADKIWANKECWTGSIGVIVGTLYDLSGLMEKYGVQAYNITSGANKDIGSMYKPMSDEQREILQSLVDESYDHFVEAVVKGRNLPDATVRKLADGRIYSAQQAMDNKLIDAVGRFEECVDDMYDAYGLECATEHLHYVPDMDIRSMLLGFSSSLKGTSEYEELLKIMEQGSVAKLEYKAPVRK